MKNKKIILTLILIISVFCGANVFAYKSITFRGVDNRDVIREDTLREEVAFGDYTIKIYRDLDIGIGGVVQIFKDEEIVFEEQNYSFMTYKESYVKDKYKMSVGKDLTGDGDPNLAFAHWSGGAHCCTNVYLFSAGDEFRFIDKFSGEHGTPVFEDVDGDGSYEVIIADWAFAYWNESFVGSPVMEVILKFNGQRYEVAYDLMKKPLERIDREYDELMKEYEDKYDPENCRQGFAWESEDVCVKSNVWSYMLLAIYGGYPDKAWEFLDSVWSGSEEIKQEFISDFKRQLAISDYADSLPIDLDGYKPDIDDESQKKQLRFKVYYDLMKDMLDAEDKKAGKIKFPPTLDDVFQKKNVSGFLARWWGLK